MNPEQYILMCEQMGWEVDESQIPKDPSTFSLEVQQALLLFNVLPDLVEGMSGSWLGKNYSGIGDILDIYQIHNKRDVFDLLKIAEQEASKFYAQKRKEADSQAKARARSKR
tara:strand:+ start:107 stop:442 length:336 start_codon:yes stop_codon:yes gene_type:complete